jgi:hypothetical protein
MNEVIRSGMEVRFPVREGSMASGLNVNSTRYSYDGLWVTCANYGGSYALGNDERWAELRSRAGSPDGVVIESKSTWTSKKMLTRLFQSNMMVWR